MSEIQCRHFTGYKPCAKNILCDSSCPSLSRVSERILIVHLEALGAVVRSTSLLAAIRRKYPNAHITWITKAPAHFLLEGISTIDRVLTLGGEDLLKLSVLEFDLALVVDKSLVAAGLLKLCKVTEVHGFVAGADHGEIIPAGRAAQELWEIGLSNQKKFFENQKSEQRLIHESLALGDYLCDDYQLPLSAHETTLAITRRRLWGADGQVIIGMNTGCSATLAHKKLTVEGHRQLIYKIRNHARLQNASIILLGGPEDSERNQAIALGLP